MQWVVVVIGLMCGSCAVHHNDKPTWYEERWGEVIPQILDNSCGLTSLLTVMHYHFGDTRYDERSLLGKFIEEASDESLKEAVQNGLTLLELEKLAQSIGYSTRRQVFRLDELERIVSIVPVIVYLEVGRFRHFAVVRGVNDREVWLADSSRGNVYHSHEQFLSEWQTPEALRKEWKHPGGLIIVRPEGEFTLRLLEEPQAVMPPSFRELRRQMLFR